MLRETDDELVVRRPHDSDAVKVVAAAKKVRADELRGSGRPAPSRGPHTVVPCSACGFELVGRELGKFWLCYWCQEGVME